MLKTLFIAMAAQTRPPERSKKIAARITGVRSSNNPRELGTMSNCRSNENMQVMKNVIVMKRVACGIRRQALIHCAIGAALASAGWLDFISVAQAMSIRTAAAKMIPNAMTP